MYRLPSWQLAGVGVMQKHDHVKILIKIGVARVRNSRFLHKARQDRYEQNFLAPQPQPDMERLMERQKTSRGNDAIIINVRDSTELRYWAEKLGCTRDEVRSAVEKVGDSLNAVRQHLAPV